jgi:hypothetical protein
MKTRRLFRDAWPLIAAALALTACKRNDATLLDLEVVTPGEACPNGGLMLHTGIDEDKDGELDEDEITSTEVVCNGETGGNGSLVVSTPLDAGDPNCPFGGVMVETGLDNGDGDGTAGDGVLQPGEVDATEFVCDGEPPFYGELIDPPAGPPGQYTIDISGGQGTAGDGGEGGYFEIEMDYGVVGGGVRIFATGDADASFTYPSGVTAYLGSNPLVVSSDLTVVADPLTGDLVDGLIYTETWVPYNNYPTLKRWNATAVAGEDITGVRVDAGATLTLPRNYDDGYQMGGAYAFENDFHLLGTVTTPKTDGSPEGLSLEPDVFVGEPTGLVDLAGDDTPGGTGGNGGWFEVYATERTWNTEENGGAIFNQSTIDVSGGNGNNGGDAGWAELEAYLKVVNAGTILAIGGTAATGDGGEGGYITLDADYGEVLNSADLDASGGDGVTSGGNAVDGVYIYNGYVGHVRNTGDLRADGGDTTGTCPSTCFGGDGGYVEFYLYANTLITTGELSARGGDATTGATTFGGEGGYFYAEGSDEDGWYAGYIPPGDFLITGNMDLSGGDGATGGDGGYFDIEYDAEYVANNQEVRLHGYTDIFLDGGDGTFNGGDGEYFYLEAEYSEYSTPGDYGPGGSVVNYADVHLGGGDGAGNGGGDGGSFEMYTETYYGYAAPWEVAVNAGNVDLSGGVGDAEGGDGGWAFVFGYSGVLNSGRFLADGGVGDGDGGGDGSTKYGITFIADYGPVVNTAELSVNGGSSAAADGGDAGIVELVGWEVQNSGALHADGGDGSTDDNYYGGDGGLLFLLSIWSTTANTTADMDILGGTGHTPGDLGEVFIDGANVTDDWD